MIMSKKFDTSKGYHAAADNVVMVEVQDIPKFVKEIQQEFKVVQCFCDELREDIDCGRRWLTKPKCIRTLRPSQETEQLYLRKGKYIFQIVKWATRRLSKFDPTQASKSQPVYTYVKKKQRHLRFMWQEHTVQTYM